MIPQRLSPDRFAAAVAQRLTGVLPAGLSVRANGARVGMYDSTWWSDALIARIVAEEDGRSIVERLETAARAIMDFTQDVVMESTREQWPVGPSGVVYPGARVVGDRLHLWFGDEVAPVLRLPPVELNELERS